MKTYFKIHSFNILFLIGFILILNPKLTKAQRDYDSKFFTGGGLGLEFGTVTLVDVSPIIGYRVTSKVDLGIGITYMYYDNKDAYYYIPGNLYYGSSSNIYGGSVFGRYHFTDNIFGHVEVENLIYTIDDYLMYTTSVVSQKETVNVTSILVGGGYRQKTGNNSYLTLMLLYNLNQTQYSPYTNPIIRVGYNFGF